jgi:hypothetical protein
MIPCTFNPRDFTERLISAVNIATTYREDVDQLNDEMRRVHNNASNTDDPIYAEARQASSIISNERHSAATPEDLA